MLRSPFSTTSPAGTDTEVRSVRVAPAFIGILLTFPMQSNSHRRFSPSGCLIYKAFRQSRRDGTATLAAYHPWPDRGCIASLMVRRAQGPNREDEKTDGDQKPKRDRKHRVASNKTSQPEQDEGSSDAGVPPAKQSRPPALFFRLGQAPAHH